MVDESVLLAFLRQAAKGLEAVEIDTAMSTSEIRSVLWNVQLEILDRVVQENNRFSSGSKGTGNILSAKEVEAELRKNSNHNAVISQEVEILNEVGRLSFARLALASGMMDEFSVCGGCHPTPKLKQKTLEKGGLTKADILEFCGLVISALRLPAVREFIFTGAPIAPSRISHCSLHFSTSTTTASVLEPHQRLNYIRSLMFRALNRDPDSAQTQMETLFSHKSSNQYHQDYQVRQAFEQMISASVAVISEASTSLTARLSDQDDGGCTRVVAVHYSEPIVDGKNRTNESSLSSHAPVREIMDKCEYESESRQPTDYAPDLQDRKTQTAVATLRQEIYQELLQMAPSERDRRLEEARKTAQMIDQQLSLKAPGMERLLFLQTLSLPVQKLLILNKLAESTSADFAGNQVIATSSSPP